MLTKWNPNNAMDVRTNTNRLLGLVAEEQLDPNTALLMCLKWMSEDEVTQMLKAYELLED